MTPFFRHIEGALACDGADAQAIVEGAGTPAYVYATRAAESACAAFTRAFAFRPTTMRYALKANAAPAVVRAAFAAGFGADATSAGEMRLAHALGAPGDAIVLSGAAKTAEDLACAVALGADQINMECPEELDAIAALARAAGSVARVAVRVNPAQGAGGHRKIITGGAGSKFGVRLRDALGLAARAAATPGARFVGFAVHVGSFVDDPQRFAPALRALAELTREAQAAGLNVETLDIGGGLAPDANPEGVLPPGLEAYARLVRSIVPPGPRLILEPGRAVVANAGVLLARVLYVKPAHGRVWALLDAGMNDFPRPALYGARHEARAVHDDGASARKTYDLAGPVCESADVLARRARLAPLRPGSLVALMGAGAYCASMASTYNGRPLPAEVEARAGSWTLIRRRDPEGWLARRLASP